MRIPRKVIRHHTIRIDNNSSCFGCGPSINRSAHNRKAKRLASKRLRKLVAKSAD